MATWGGSCTDNNNTFSNFSPQCKLDEAKDEAGNPLQCTVTATSCGCHYDVGQSGSSAVGTDSFPGCGNACVSISADAPNRTSCSASGSSMRFEGSCDSRDYTYTPQCGLEEADGECIVSEQECGCLYWEPDVDFMNGLASPGCDACAVGKGEVPASGAEYSYRKGSIVGLSSLVAFVMMMTMMMVG